MKAALVIAAFMLTAVVADAQPVSGFYVGGSAGLALPQSQSLSVSPGASNAPRTSASAAANAAINGRAGALQSGSAGWGFGDGLRMEIEGVHTAPGRQHNQLTLAGVIVGGGDP